MKAVCHYVDFFPHVSLNIVKCLSGTVHVGERIDSRCYTFKMCFDAVKWNVAPVIRPLILFLIIRRSLLM